MAADADGIPSIRIEVCRVHDGRLATGAQMIARVSVAGFARNPGMKKRKPSISVDGAGEASLNRAHVAAQAGTLYRDRGRNLSHIREPGLHVVTTRGCIPGDRRF